MNDTRYRSIATWTQELTLWFAGAFLSLGFYGLVPGLTKHLDTLAIGSPYSEAKLFGIFSVSLLHNGVHLLLGAGALAAAGAHRVAQIFLLAVSIALIASVIYGQLDPTPVVDSLIPVGRADAWLHTTLALVMFVVAVTAPGRRSTRD